VPLVVDLMPIVDRWSAGKALDAWLFEAPRGGPLRESNWKRSVGWSAATASVGLQGFRVHDLRHTAASVWQVSRVASDASFGSLRERALPAAQHAAMRRSRCAGALGGACDLGCQHLVASGAGMCRLIWLQRLAA